MDFYKRNIVLGDLIAFLNNGNETDLICLDLILYDIKCWQNRRRWRLAEIRQKEESTGLKGSWQELIWGHSGFMFPLTTLTEERVTYHRLEGTGSTELDCWYAERTG